MSREIHPTAFVDPSAQLGEGVSVGPHAVVGPEVTVGAGTRIDAGAQVMGPSTIGSENRIFPYACVGFEPQDLKFEGERTRLEVGDRNVFREFSTVHRGTGHGGGLTTVGSDNLFMVYTHVAHDCHVGDRTVFANCATLAGHVEVADDATVGAFSSVHQFCRIGRHAYVGGYSVVTRDALPYVKTVGQKPLCYGLNTIGLKRKGMSDETLTQLQGAMRILLRGRLSRAEALERLTSEFGGVPEVEYLVEFLLGSERGVITNLPGAGRGGRGGVPG